METFKFSWLIIFTQQNKTFRLKIVINMIAYFVMFSNRVDCKKKYLKHLRFYRNQYSINKKNMQ